MGKSKNGRIGDIFKHRVEFEAILWTYKYVEGKFKFHIWNFVVVLWFVAHVEGKFKF